MPIRLFTIIFSILLLLGFMGYGYLQSDTIRNIPFENTEKQIASNGTKIIETGTDFFTIRWKDDTLKTILIDHPPPFKKNDVASFLAVKDGKRFHIKEFHIWESRSMWYVKAALSAFPMLFVIIFFLRHFRFDISQFIFVEKKDKNA